MSKSERRDNINGFLFALPWIIGFVCFSLIPLLTSFYYSFTSFNPVKPPEWIGLENFKYIFQDPLVFKSLKILCSWPLYPLPSTCSLQCSLLPY